MDRREMADILEEHLHNVNVYFDREEKFPKGRGPLKTYIVEAHRPDGNSLDHGDAAATLVGIAKDGGFDVRETRDETLFQLTKGEVGFFFDLLDPRFWIVHTMSLIEDCEELINGFVEVYPYLDYAWPPSDLMRSIQGDGKPLGFAVDFDETELLADPEPEKRLIDEPNAVVKFRFGGTRAEAWLSELERFAPDALAFSMVKFAHEDQSTRSYIIDELNERGRFKAAGNSFNLHIQTVSRFLHSYRSFILEIEDVARIRSSGKGEGGGLLQGDPLVLEFPKPLRNFSGFVRELVSCRAPLKIWGIVDQVRSNFVQIEAVDLHTSSRLRLDLTPEYVRIYLGPEACGNTVARLLRNLQSHVDSTIRLNIPSESVSA
ncbi:MAG: hypothetical protein ABSA41_08765 [Terriglobia bacterium]|jgi:hypothetical protein